MAHPRSQAARWLRALKRPETAPESAPRQGDLLQSESVAAGPAPAPAGKSTEKPLREVAPRALPAREAETLWLALRLPSLWLTAALRTKPATAPLVVLALQNRVQRVIALDAAARDCGIMVGASLSAALALCPVLDTRERNLRAERALLEQLALLGLQFTSRVSIERPDALLLEVKGSLGLFGGVQPLCEAIEQRCAQLAVPVQLSLAPTPLAALAGARVGRALRVTNPAQLVGELSALPLEALDWPADQIERFASMGVRQIGQVLRLPREGFTRRFGKAARLRLDRLLGQAPDPRSGFIARERFAARCEPSYELSEHAAILQYCEPLLADLERFLRTRQAGIDTLLLRLVHRRPGGLSRERIVTPLWLRLVQPELAAERFLSLLREHLARQPLPGAVLRIEMRSGRLLPFAPDSASLWRPGEHGGATGQESPVFIERLRARLGPDAVYGLCLVPEHRPEAAWRVAEPRSAGSAAVPVVTTATSQRRPLWLLHEPEMLPVENDTPATAGLTLQGGPERIESGWWDGRDVARDYYLARHSQGVEVWVYRERQAPHRWYLHGVFG